MSASRTRVGGLPHYFVAVGEQVEVSRRAVNDPVKDESVSAPEDKAVPLGGIQRNAGDIREERVDGWH